MKNKCFVVDIDGCITTGKSYAMDLSSLSDLSSLIHQESLDFFLCSGRSAPYVEAITQLLSLTQLCICENGAYLYSPELDEVEYHPLVTSELLVILNTLKQQLLSKSAKLPAKFELGKEVCLSLNPVAGNVSELYRRVKKIFKEASLFDILTIQHSNSAVDITPKGVDKGSALSLLAQKEGFSLENVIAIGDSEGDLPFMTLAGISACPANASHACKQQADFISQYSTTNGVIDIIKYFS
jgi:HAD superfamily hydrolase (TIGR01484 family)